MGNRRGTSHYAALREKLDAASALLENEEPGADEAKVKMNLRFALDAVQRLNPINGAGDTTISLEDVCRFLRIRGEGLGDREFERAVKLPHRIFVPLERAAGKQDDLDQLQYALAGAIAALPRGSAARRLLTSAAALGKKMALAFHLTSDVPLKQIDSAKLRLEDACRAVEQVFRFTSAEDVVRTTGVPLEIVKQLDSAAAFAGKREGWGDY